MSPKYQKTKPSFLEGGLPCASLSAECQRDNNARQRPPQNRLHIWWARRPPTISRAAILAALLPYNLELDDSILPPMIDEPSDVDIENLPGTFIDHISFFQTLLNIETPILSNEHNQFLRALGVTGDANAASIRIDKANQYIVGGKGLQMPVEWGYRHPPAFRVTPSGSLIKGLSESIVKLIELNGDKEITLLDFMAGGGSIPLEGVRYGLKVFANDLNPVASIALQRYLI